MANEPTFEKGKINPKYHQRYYVVSKGKGKKNSYREHRYLFTKEAALKVYRGIRVKDGQKKRLLEPIEFGGKILKRQITTHHSD